MSTRVLLVDDDRLLRRGLSFSLGRAGYRVTTAADVDDALVMARHVPLGLVLLDTGFPSADGLTALRRFHRETNVPVIMLTASQRELDQVLALEQGADDYVTKPFDLGVLLARMKAVLRRSQSRPARRRRPDRMVAGNLVIDAASRTVLVGGRRVELPARQFDLLCALAEDAGHLLTTDDLLTRVWGAEHEGQGAALYVHMHWLRENLEEDPHHPRRIVTVRGAGYRLEPRTD